MYDPTTFYSAYLKDYHKTKAIALKKILDNIPHYSKDLLGEDADTNLLSDFEKTFQADLRQTFFHAVETMFELLFAFDAITQGPFDDWDIQFYLTDSNWRKNFERIERIATDDKELDFLDEEIEFEGHKISRAHYIFYFGTFDQQKFPEKFFSLLKESAEAIKDAIRMVAKEFADRGEYNSYKHGLRLIPALGSLSVLDPKTKEELMIWDLSDSMSFYQKTKDPNVIKIITKVFDPEKDYKMTYVCSNIISQMIYYRSVGLEKRKNPEGEIKIQFFGKQEIEESNATNVKIQNLVYTMDRTRYRPQSPPKE